MQLAIPWRETGARVALVAVVLFVITFDHWLVRLWEDVSAQRSETRLEARDAVRVQVADAADGVLDMYLLLVTTTDDAGGAAARHAALQRLGEQLDALAHALPLLLDGEEKLLEGFAADRQAWLNRRPEVREADLALRDRLVGHLVTLHLELSVRSVRDFSELGVFHRLRRLLLQMHRATGDELIYVAGLDPAGLASDNAVRRGATEADRRRQAELLLQAAGVIDDDTVAAVRRFLDNYRGQLDGLATAPATDRRQALAAAAGAVDAELAALATANQKRIADLLLARRQQLSREFGTTGILTLLHGIAVIVLLALLFRYARRPTLNLKAAMTGADGHFVDWNVEARTLDLPLEFDVMLGYEPGELPRTVDGMRWLYHPEDAPVLEAGHRAAFHGQTDRVDAELRMRRKGGGWHWINMRARVVERRANGRARRVVGVVFDANRRHVAEEELRQLRAEEEAIFNNSPVAMMIVSERIIRRVNAATVTLFRRPQADLVGSTTRLLFPDDAGFELVGRQVYGALRTAPSSVYVGTYQRGDGETFLTRVHCRLLDIGRPDAGYAFAFTEIGDEHQAAKTVEASLDRLRDLFAALPVGVVVVRDRVIVDCNPAYAALMGTTPTALVGQNSRVAYPDPAQWERYGDRVYDEMRKSGRYTGRSALRHVDGHRVEVGMAGSWLAAEDPSRGAVFVVTPRQTRSATVPPAPTLDDPQDKP